MVIRIIINSNIGELTENKIRKIQEIWTPEFPAGGSTPTQIIASGEQKNIVITNSTIEYIVADSKDIKVQETIIKLYDLLMLDNNLNNLSILISEAVGEEYSMEYIQNKYTKIIDDSIGIGIRSFFAYEDVLCEFKVEPYLDDPKRMYIEGIYNFRNKLVNKLDEVIKGTINDYTNKKGNLNI